MRSRPLRISVTAMALSSVFAVSALAQERREEPGGELPPYAQRIELPEQRGGLDLVENGLPNILVTGYWPPTNEMLRQFSTDPVQNPGGWVGENWESRGYNVYAFFPEFPGGVGQGQGDFEVDYQDTSGDWWSIVPQVKPIALITFSRAANDFGWEMEGGNRTYVAANWTPDYRAPTQPTPELPIMDLEPPGTERWSTLPMEEIRAAVRAQVPALDPYIEPIDNSRYLSNFIGYHGNWYHDLHSHTADPLYNLAAGHIHVGYQMQLADAVHAAEVSVRTLITHVDELRGTPIPVTSEWGMMVLTLLTLTAGTLVFMPRRSPAAAVA